MSTSIHILRLWFEDDRLYIQTDHGEILSQHLSLYRRLAQATPAQREQYTVSPFGLHWPLIDEDVSFESFFWPENDPHRLVAK